MKQGRNFLVLIVFVFFFSCINETPIDGEGGGSASEETTVTIQLPIEGILTKGTDPDTDLYATAKELEIHNCVIAIFDSNGMLAGYKRVVKGDKDLAAPEDQKVHVGNDPKEPEGNSQCYTIANVTTRRGQGMTILVIANSENARTTPTGTPNQWPAEVGVTTFADYDALYETSLPFLDERLVKVGLLTDYALEEKNTQRIVVALTQLSARIDFRIILGDDLIREGWSYSINRLEKNNQRYVSYLLYPGVPTGYTETDDNPVTVTYATTAEKDIFLQKGHTFYTYQKKCYSTDELAGQHDAVFVDVNLDLMKGELSVNKTYRLLINPKGLGPNKDRNGLLAGNLYEVKAKLNSISLPEEPGGEDIVVELQYEVVGWWGNGETVVSIPDFE